MSHVLLLVLLLPQPLFCCARACRWSDSHREEVSPCLLRVGIATLML